MIQGQQRAEILKRSRFVPVVVMFKSSENERLHEYYLHGKEMKLHLFKKMCKKMPPIEIVVFENA